MTGATMVQWAKFLRGRSGEVPVGVHCGKCGTQYAQAYPFPNWDGTPRWYAQCQCRPPKAKPVYPK